MMNLILPEVIRAKTQWDDLLYHLHRIDHPLEYLIHSTPTGELRNHLTNVNIHMMGIAAELGKALALAVHEAKKLPR